MNRFAVSLVRLNRTRYLALTTIPCARTRTGFRGPTPPGDGDGVTADVDPVVFDGDGQAATADGGLDRAEAAAGKSPGPQRAEDGVR